MRRKSLDTENPSEHAFCGLFRTKRNSCGAARAKGRIRENERSETGFEHRNARL
jgi:hypothetical protein